MKRRGWLRRGERQRSRYCGVLGGLRHATSSTRPTAANQAVSDRSKNGAEATPHRIDPAVSQPQQKLVAPQGPTATRALLTARNKRSVRRVNIMEGPTTLPSGADPSARPRQVVARELESARARGRARSRRRLSPNRRVGQRRPHHVHHPRVVGLQRERHLERMLRPGCVPARRRTHPGCRAPRAVRLLQDGALGSVAASSSRPTLA